MTVNLQTELGKFVQQPQRKDDAVDQWNELIPFANKGLCDAVDLMKVIVSTQRPRESIHTSA